MAKASILVADDESPIRLMLRTALESQGYDVAEAADGQSALDAVNRAAPDLMVLDLNMPGMDGLTVLERMKSLAGMRPRVIVLTAYGSIPAAVKATHLGAANVLEKPLTPRVLRASIKEALEAGRPDTEIPQRRDDGRRDDAFTRVRGCLRLAEYADAQMLLAGEAERSARRSADYFNLLGVLHERKKQWLLARRCYGKAISADREFEPAQSNMRRMYELNTFGHTTQPLMLGDDDPQGLAFRMPDARG